MRNKSVLGVVNLVVVSEMIDALMRSQVHVVHDIVNPFFFSPKDVPVSFMVTFFPSSSFKSLENTVFERSFKLDVGTEKFRGWEGKVGTAEQGSVPF